MASTTSSKDEGAASALPPRVHRPPAPIRARGHQTSPTERRAIIAVAVLGGLAGAFAEGEPTLFLLTNVAYRAGAAVILSLATSRARRWSWLVLGALAAVGAPAGLWFAVTCVGLGVGFLTTVFPRRRLFGAIVGACAAQGLLRYTDVGSGRSSLLLVAVATLPVMFSAYSVSPRRVRRQIHRALVVGAGLALAATLLFGLSAGLAYSSTQRGVKDAKSGLNSARDGRGQDAATQLRRSSTSFEEAHNLVDAWWARAAGAMPFVAQQAHAVQVLTAEGAAMTHTAAATADQADIRQLKYTNGRIDVEKLAMLQGPLGDTAAAFDHAARAVDEVRSPWLVGPLRTRVDEFDAELHATLPEVELAADASKTGPRLLGASGRRNYLVLFTQPAESRALGGFVGNWAELSASDGRLEVTKRGRADDINPKAGEPSWSFGSPPVPRDFVDRYQRFDVGRFFQDVTLSPDLPSVAAVAGEIFPKVQQDHLDGVMTIDPYALAALLNFTGPIKVDGYDTPLNADNAADILIKQQYSLTDNNGRKDFLDQASQKTFETLVHGSLPSPKKVADVLGPVVEQRRLSFAPLGDDDATSLLRRLNADGAFHKPDGNDFFEVVTQNKANNKIDSYLQRSVDYDVRFDPESGDVEGAMTVTLKNNAPSSGAPLSIIGNNDQGLPLGTNRAFVSVYTPFGLREAKIDGLDKALEFQRELGYAVYSTYVDVPPGGAVTMELRLFGHLDPKHTYRLAIATQPLVNPDRVTVHLRSTSDWEILRTSGMTIDAGRGGASLTASPLAGMRVEAEMGRP